MKGWDFKKEGVNKGKRERRDRRREMGAGGDSRVSSSLLMAKEQRGSY